MKNRFRMLSYPYIVWMAIFIIGPILLILFYSFTSGNVHDLGSMSFSIGSYKKLFNLMYLKVIAKSFYLAAVATALCFLLGYPVALIIVKAEARKRNLLMLFFLVPIWMNFLLRTYAWMSILSPNGFINRILAFFGLPMLNIMPGQSAVVLGMVYNFLPFMVLPIYTVLSKIDKSVVEAAMDLGANNLATFIKVVFPLSIPGIITGITMVFMPAVSTFVISRLLGGGKDLLIGNLIEQQFTVQRDWHFGSALSIVLMVLILLSMAVMSSVDKEEHQGGGGLF